MSEITLLIGLAAAAVALWCGYRTLRLWKRYRTLPPAADGATDLVDGERVTVEGEIVVDEPADAGEHAGAMVEGDSPIALVIWRVQRIRSGNRRSYTFDFVNRTFKRSGRTVEAGLEAGRFSLDDGAAPVRVDTDWLEAEYGGSDLAEFSPSGLRVSTPRSFRVWSTPYLTLRKHASIVPLKRMQGMIAGGVPANLSLGRYRVESRAVPGGGSIAVHGEAAIESGERVIRGTDETPMIVSDLGIDGLRNGLRNKIALYGVGVLGGLAVGGYFVSEAITSGVI